jgi:cephalosporin-C deacetylase-like acetyl esterase
LNFFGYGVEKQYPHSGSDDEIVFAVNAHGYELDRDESYYKNEFRHGIGSGGKSYGLDPRQNRDAEESYFNGMALRVMRAIEFVKSLEPWNGRELVVNGRSQGGLQAVWGAAQDHDVTLCETSITWCTNMAGASKDGRLPGWHPEWVEALGYYDTINHARYIQCPVKMARAGLGDYTCPPSGLAALYMTFAVPKEITWVQGSTHSYVPPNPEKCTVNDR